MTTRKILSLAVCTLFMGLGLGSVDLDEIMGKDAPAEPADNAVGAPGTKPTSDLHEELGYKMVRIKAGSFTMGSYYSDAGRQEDEGLHQVKLTRDFWVGTTEVTQALYQEVMGSNPSSYYGSRYPVETVSWYDAIEFTNRMSRRAGLDEAYGGGYSSRTYNPRANGYRLLTEAEWEFAARGGVRNDGGAPLYSGSFGYSQVAWVKENSSGRPHPVGSLSSNPWGLYDMSGNVFEWVWDWHPCASNERCTKSYPSENVDPTGWSYGSERVFRGGRFSDRAKYARVANRGMLPPSSRMKWVGFRIARTAD